MPVPPGKPWRVRYQKTKRRVLQRMNVAVPSEAEKQVSGADDAITTVEEVFGERPYYGSGETGGSYVYYSQVFPKDADQDQYLPEEEHVEGDDTYRLVDYEVKEQSLSGRKKHIRDTLLLKDYEGSMRFRKPIR